MRTVLGLFLVGISALGADLDLKAIRDLVESKKITSKAELLRQLPGDCKKYYTLVYASRATPCSSYEKPRVIMTCTTSHAYFIMGIDGDSPTAGRSCEGVEILETSPSTGGIRSAEIHFKPGVGHEYIADPERCNACHGKPMKHMADQYPNWPGYYESTLRNLRVGSREWQGYQEYKRLREVDPFYSQLQLFDEDKGAEHPTDFLSFRVPGELTRFHSAYFNHLGRLNDLRAKSAIAGHPDYPRYRFALEAASRGCRDLAGYLPASLKTGTSWEKSRSELAESLKTAEKRSFEKVAFHNTNIEPGFPLTASEFDSAAGIFFVIAKMGFDPHCFSTTISRQETAFPVSAFTPRFEQTTDSCEELREKSLTALAGAKPGAGMTPSHTWDPEFLFQRCVSCHQAGNVQKELGAPPIPFAKNSVFQAYLDANPAMTHKIRQRVKDTGRLRMPPVESLHEAEKEAIYRFLDGG